jgi:hypothetical protein
MSRILLIFIILSFPINTVVANEPPTYEELQARIAELEKEIETLKDIIQGTAHPINLGRTSLASVTASSVNGRRALNNIFHGILNAFDGGENWVNNINYTYWTASGGSGFVDVYFDHPVSLTSIYVEGAPPFTTTVRFSEGGEENFVQVSEKLDFETPIHGVASVRLGFKQNTGNLKVNEIKIFGFIPPDIEYTVGIPRLFITARSAETMAETAYRQWIDLFLPDQNTPIMKEEQEEFVFIYQKGTMDILQVKIDKHTGEATTEELVELVSRSKESDEQTIPAPGEN